LEEAPAAIVGKVRAEDGTPLEGVLVRATGVRRRPPGERRGRRDLFEEPDVEQQVRDLLADHRWRQATQRETRTDASGAFSLSELADATYSVAAAVDGYEVRAVGRSSGVEPGGRVDFVAWTVVEVPFLVLLPDGRPAEGAEIEFDAEGRGSTTSPWSAERARVPMRPATYRVRASAGAASELRSESQTVAVEDGVEPSLVTLRLEGRTGIRGRIVFPEGEEPERAILYTLRLAGGAGEETLRSEGTKTWVRRGWNFAFDLMDLPSGSYLLGAALDEQCPLALTQTVEVLDRVAEVEFAFPPLDPREFVLLRVLDPRGRNLRDVQIVSGFRGSKGSSSGSAAVIARDDGTFLVRHHSPSGGETADGVNTIRARSPRYGEKEVEYVRGRVAEVTIAFEEPAVLEAAVAGYVGSGLEGSLRLLLRKGDPGGRPRNWSPFHDGGREGLDAEGRRSFGPVQPGPYEVVLGIRDEGNRHRPVEVVSIPLVPGENRLSVPIPPLYRLTVLVEDPRPGAQLLLEPRTQGRGGWSSRERLGEDGQATFARLLAGDYRLSLVGSGRAARMSVSLPGPEHLVFTPER